MSQNEVIVNPESQKFVKLIAKGKGVLNKSVGVASTKPKEYIYFDSLLLVTFEQELFELTNHSDAKVRCYSFWGLCKLNSKLKYQVLKNRREDDALVFTLNGCIGTYISVYSFMNSKISEVNF